MLIGGWISSARSVGAQRSAAEAVQGAALALECVHHIHGGHGLAASVLGVGHGITDHVLQEHLCSEYNRECEQVACQQQSLHWGLQVAGGRSAQHVTFTSRL